MSRPPEPPVRSGRGSSATPSAPLLALCIALAACRTAPAPKPADGTPASPAALPPIDEAALDRTASPCDDFYQFACGGWIARAEIPADKPAWSRGFFELRERNLRELRDLAEAAAAGQMGKDDRFADKVGDFWASCMDEAAVEAHGLADLQTEWGRIDAVKDRPALAAEMARLARSGIAAPFGLTAGPDSRDATRMIAELPQGGLSLPDREYYLSEDPKMAAIRESYGAYVRALLELAGVPATDAAAQAASVQDLERAIAESHFDKVAMRDPIKTYNKLDRAGLARLAPAFPWPAWLEGLGHPGIDAVDASTPPFLERVGQLYANAPIDQWRAYLRWQLLRRMASARALPRAFVERAFTFASQNFTGAKELEPRWKRCVAMTDGALGQAIGQAYVRRYFGADGKERTTRLVAEIEAAMKRDLEALPWMDPPTRSAAEQKLARVANKIGYPDVWRDYSTMQVSRASHFRNVLAADAFEVNRLLSQAGGPVDRNEWLMTPPTVNAYYEPTRNEMVFPAGILQPPFFNKAAPEPVNYGGTGMVVGHELTHGFDDQGRQFDADGNLRDWWTPAVGKEFDARAQCVAAQYDGYEALPGVHLNGKLTLGENIADLGGLKLAHAALRGGRGGQPEGAPVAGFTAEQQFFMGAAQIWCFKGREQYVRMLATVDPHSPPRFRVNGPLSNLPEFAAAFGCREGSPMARPAAERCSVW